MTGEVDTFSMFITGREISAIGVETSEAGTDVSGVLATELEETVESSLFKSAFYTVE